MLEAIHRDLLVISFSVPESRNVLQETRNSGFSVTELLLLEEWMPTSTESHVALNHSVIKLEQKPDELLLISQL